MWQRFPNMFRPPFPSHLLHPLPSAAFVKQQSQRGMKWEWWADCMTVMSEVSVSQHSHPMQVCVCVCAFIIRLLMSRKTLRAAAQAQAERATCNLAASRTFEANLMPFFLQPAMLHLSKWVECSQKWSEVAFFLGRACVCAPTLHRGKPSWAKARQASSSSSSFSCVCILRCMHSLCTVPLACLPIRFLAPLHSVLPACNFVGIFLGKMSINARVQLIKRLSNVATATRWRDHQLKITASAAWVTFHLCFKPSNTLHKREKEPPKTTITKYKETKSQQQSKLMGMSRESAKSANFVRAKSDNNININNNNKMWSAR